MKILILIIKEFKQNIRNWKANLMMVLFPVVLIIILGVAFTNVFNSSSVDLSNVKVLYTLQGGSYLTEAFKNFAQGVEKELGMTFEAIDDMDKGMNNIKDNKYSCYIVVYGSPEEIKIYKNARYSQDADMVESLLKMFTGRYGAYAVIARTNPSILDKITSDTTMDFVKTESLDKKRQPGSLDYYAVTMLTLILLYASLTGFWSFKTEQNMRTGSRILCAPVRKYEVLVGKVLGGIVVTIVQACVVLLFSKYILKADWGRDIATVMVIVIAESIMAISMGTGISFLIRNEGAASGILNTFIPVIVFFGGGYVPLSQMGEGIERLSVISPVKWTNDALFRVIYNNDYSTVPIAILVNLAIAAAFIIVAAVFSRKEAA